jgi:sec-independent protein translocase protein TatA
MLAGPDLLVILVIALVVFGPKKLPEIGQAIGNAMREFKKASEETRESLEEPIREDGDTKEHSKSTDAVINLSEKIIGSSAFPEKAEKASFPLLLKKGSEVKE